MESPTEDVPIAIVDDDESLCLSLVDLVGSNGYQAEAFSSAERFLESGKLSGWGCIIADVHMPGMSGFELLRECRERGIARPIILITALPDPKFDGEAASSGAFCLLRKPFKASVLLDCLRRGLEDGPREQQ
jgi:FixJ family two-component response regulator